jgi:ABC-type phosphate/phosphonate transport system substrate-binding protein
MNEKQLCLFHFRKYVKEFLDLRGCRWAFSGEDSLSASTVILKTLKELGENASFFGNTLSK